MTSEEQKNETKVFNKSENEPKEGQDTNNRKKRREAKEAKKKETEKKPGFFKRRIRFIPVWLRVILVAALCVGAFIFGLSFGYATLGEGEDPSVVRDLEFWENIWDYIQGK
ncbi:DNA-directed RNA polymerase subunit beta [Filobacillus milosensis]|uniref:DNA-directed RNA polymerase subunit beta n=1 Tax=Filobacillus milosensis TaxID=94137 RepID=A0A4Y8II19_9BACI|nr:DNA-directed RNA polymerase subunit beta [Filobacillus milosensis]TFB19269.1 DNA-directed RNA polymerase subunit beta [Filobacillus milosensis]